MFWLSILITASLVLFSFSDDKPDERSHREFCNAIKNKATDYTVDLRPVTLFLIKNGNGQYDYQPVHTEVKMENFIRIKLKLRDFQVVR